MRYSSVLAVFSASVFLSACQQGVGALTPSGQNDQKPLSEQPKIPLSAKVEGEKVGNGPVRIALLVPKGAQGGAGRVGKQLANAAKLAVRDFGAGRIQLVIKDTKGQAATAQTLANQARNEGASLILGPLFSGNVSAASGVTKTAGLPMIAFTSDAARAAPGVYLLSITPQADAQRTLNYGFSKGATRLMALLPQGVYGSLIEKEMRRVATANRAQIISVVRYKPDAASINTAIRSAVLATGTANGIYIPEGGSVPSTILKGLKAAGAQLDGKLIMGSGQWQTAKLNDLSLSGAIFAGPPKANFETFAGRYSRTYGGRPVATAALGYDAVSLAAELVRRSAQNPFTPNAIQSRSGFNGATGLFRFQSSGRLQRGLDINRVQPGSFSVAEPSPKGFSARR